MLSRQRLKRPRNFEAEAEGGVCGAGKMEDMQAVNAVHMRGQEREFDRRSGAGGRFDPCSSQSKIERQSMLTRVGSLSDSALP